MMLDAVGPEYFIPLHGEYRHLAKHAKLAREAGISKENVLVIEDGQWIELGMDGLQLGLTLELQKGVVVGNVYFDGSKEVFQQRAKLARTGIVFVVLVVDGRKGNLTECPRVATHGLLYRHGIEPSSVLKDVERHLESVYQALSKKAKLEEEIILETRRFFKKRVSHKPVVIPMVVHI